MDETIYGKCGYLSVKWEFRKIKLNQAVKALFHWSSFMSPFFESGLLRFR